MAETPAEVLARLKQQEATSGRSGAISRTPKQQMMDARDVEAKHPDKHLRWVNILDKQKAEVRKMEGYTALPESEGGRRLGDDYVLMAIPKDKFEQRVAQQRRENLRRLNAHNDEWGEQMEAAARMLRDNYGIKVTPEQLTRI